MARLILTIVRWWFGLTYVLGGIGAVIAGQVMIALGNYGGVYMIVGGSVMGVLGWTLHPWGLQRQVAHS